ncbi:hypothetical protein RM549_03275 [Salegentibacter sp. F188]|uniref:Uncharacterized protein n=1 Tax=Autumnicola patrickiae TaxID=3075591 RepID=A0ABU3DYI5_9FLAO|nr:hypothetical protein [Salegentibacter sp. F188]MDT0688788.1 hypothetical protein [Salegentibacter sp. F188]
MKVLESNQQQQMMFVWPIKDILLMVRYLTKDLIKELFSTYSK